MKSEDWMKMLKGARLFIVIKHFYTVTIVILFFLQCLNHPNLGCHVIEMKSEDGEF